MDILLIHLGILGLTILGVLYADHLGWQYFRGTRGVLPLRTVRTLHYAVSVGLVGMIGTGLLMAYPALDVLIVQPLFELKMGFVLVLVLNSFFIGSLLSVATTTPYAELSQKQKTPLMISGVLSTIGWVGAIICGFLF